MVSPGMRFLARFLFLAAYSRFALLFAAAMCWTSLSSGASPSVEWKPVTPEELKLDNVPGAVGAPAVCLFSEVFTDDVAGREHHYFRVKVLTEEGRGQGNLTIPYVKEYWELSDFHARIIQSDGSITENTAAPSDSLVVRYKSFKAFAKTLVLPDVKPGTIIEYQYDLTGIKGRFAPAPWIVNGSLYTLRASFSKRPGHWLGLRWVAQRLPKDVHANYEKDGLIHLELTNVPASQMEDFMPPEAESRPRVDFYYYFGKSHVQDVDLAWTEISESVAKGVEKYLSDEHGLNDFLAAVTSSDEAPEVRLHKLYDRVQSMRNLSYENEKSQAQFKREKLKDSESVGQVIKHGYGWHEELDLLFVAVLRRAGFDASLLAVARRDGEYFFEPKSLSFDSLPSRAVLVKLNGKAYFLDPAIPCLPFGWLPWGETSVKALLIHPVAGGLISTPDPIPMESGIERKAHFTLDENGDLDGTVTVSYLGFEAFDRRIDAWNQDDVAKRHTLENQLQEWIPGTAEVTLQRQPEWSQAASTLTAEFHVQIKEWASHAGQRLLCPEGIFSKSDRSLFQSETRVHDLYFAFPSVTRDAISLSIPANYHVEALPTSRTRDLGFQSYNVVVQAQDATVQVARTVTLKRNNLPQTVYSGIRAFYQDLRVADESQIVLSAASAPAQ